MWSTVEFRSGTLNMPVTIEVVSPEQISGCKVLVLLHDLGGDRTQWLLKSNLSDVANNNNLLIVLPSIKRSFGLNMANGYKYQDFIANEIPAKINALYDVSDFVIAGVGMGGFAALNAMTSGTYSDAFAFAPMLDKAEIDANVDAFERELIFGNGGYQGFTVVSGNIYKEKSDDWNVYLERVVASL